MTHLHFTMMHLAHALKQVTIANNVFFLTVYVFPGHMSITITVSETYLISLVNTAKVKEKKLSVKVRT